MISGYLLKTYPPITGWFLTDKNSGKQELLTGVVEVVPYISEIKQIEKCRIRVICFTFATHCVKIPLMISDPTTVKH